MSSLRVLLSFFALITYSHLLSAESIDQVLANIATVVGTSNGADCVNNLGNFFSTSAVAYLGDLGNFGSRKLIAEYFCIGRVSIPGYIHYIDGTFQLVDHAKEDHVAWVHYRVMIEITGLDHAVLPPKPLDVYGTLTFNNKKEVTEATLVVDKQMSYIQWVSNAGLMLATAQLGHAPSPVESLTGICNMIQAFCTGQYLQYADVPDCVNLLASKPVNAFPMFFSDTITCRANHLPMTTVDPALHCPHVGPTGGGACV